MWNLWRGLTSSIKNHLTSLANCSSAFPKLWNTLIFAWCLLWLLSGWWGGEPSWHLRLAVFSHIPLVQRDLEIGVSALFSNRTKMWMITNKWRHTGSWEGACLWYNGTGSFDIDTPELFTFVVLSQITHKPCTAVPQESLHAVKWEIAGGTKGNLLDLSVVENFFLTWVEIFVGWGKNWGGLKLYVIMLLKQVKLQYGR